MGYQNLSINKAETTGANPVTISTDEITTAFLETCDHANGITLEQCLSNERGTKTDCINSIIESLFRKGKPFNTFILSADGGIRDLLVIYEAAGYQVIAYRHTFGNAWPFNNVQIFARWINILELDILTALIKHATGRISVN